MKRLAGVRPNPTERRVLEAARQNLEQLWRIGLYCAAIGRWACAQTFTDEQKDSGSGQRGQRCIVAGCEQWAIEPLVVTQDQCDCQHLPHTATLLSGRALDTCHQRSVGPQAKWPISSSSEDYQWLPMALLIYIVFFTWPLFNWPRQEPMSTMTSCHSQYWKVLCGTYTNSS